MPNLFFSSRASLAALTLSSLVFTTFAASASAAEAPTAPSPPAPVVESSAAPESTDDSTDAPDTTVIAPPGGPGLTVVAPVVGGGSVTASGCSQVTVSGGTTLVVPSPECPQVAPYRPYVPDYAPRFEESRPRFASDPLRITELVLGSIAAGFGGLWMMDRLDHVDADSCNRSPRAGSYGCMDTAGVVTAIGLMALAPGVATFEVGDRTRALWFSAAIAASAGLGVVFAETRSSQTSSGATTTFAFVIPAALGIAELATTPHREDIAAKSPAPRDEGPRLASIAPTLLSDTRGTHGAALTIAGAF